MAIHIHLHSRQVSKTKDAGFGKQVEYDPRAVSRLKSDIAAEKLLLSKKKMGQQERSDRQKHIAELEQELSRFRDGGPGSGPQEGGAKHISEITRLASSAKEESKKFDSPDKEIRRLATQKIGKYARAQELHKAAITAHNEASKYPDSAIRKTQAEKASNMATEYVRQNNL